VGYFDFIPKTPYRIEDGNATIAKNILTRVRILDATKDSQSTFLDYTIQDGERPETLAERVYGRSDYHWIILMFNEIIDPYFSWPLSNDQLDDQVEKIYGNGRKALFIDVPSIRLDSEKVNALLDQRKPYFEVGSTITQIDVSDGTTVLATGTVEEWNPTLMKLVVMPVSGTFRKQWEGQQAIRPNSTTDASLVYDILFTTKDGTKGKACLVRLTDENKMAIHHFENENGEEVSPWTNTCDHLKSPSNCDTCSGDFGWCTVIESYVLGNSETPVVRKPEIDETMNVFVVTNAQYELNQNESKRRIKMMRSDLIDVVLREFRRIVDNTVT
jgi:hypothetical protein